MSLTLENQRIVVTGGAGFLGQAVCRELQQQGAIDIRIPRQRDYDLTDRAAVERMYADLQPHIVVHLAAEVGGIGANQTHPGRFFYANLSMGLHLIEAGRQHGVQKFVQIGTVCAYPKFTPVPFHEEALWDGYPEETNAPYGVAKKALLVMLQSYRQEYNFPGIYLLPVNLYGPHDHFNLATSHVIPALIRKCVTAKESGAAEIVVWGTGQASREFLYVEDCARGIVQALRNYESPEPVNLGAGEEISIRELVELIAELCGFTGTIRWDSTRPDGQPRRCLETSRARNAFGWSATTSLRAGLQQTIDWYLRERPEH